MPRDALQGANIVADRPSHLGVGEGVGEGVGNGVGTEVGEGVGEGVGDGVGAGVGLSPDISNVTRTTVPCIKAGVAAEVECKHSNPPHMRI